PGDRDFGRPLACLRAPCRRYSHTIELNSGAPAARAAWQQQLAQVAAVDARQSWQSPVLEPWVLAARAHMNPGSAGGAVFHLELQPPPGTAPSWQAGDLAEIHVPADPDRPRDYSVASIPGTDVRTCWGASPW